MPNQYRSVASFVAPKLLFLWKGGDFLKTNARHLRLLFGLENVQNVGSHERSAPVVLFGCAGLLGHQVDERAFLELAHGGHLLSLRAKDWSKTRLLSQKNMCRVVLTIVSACLRLLSHHPKELKIFAALFWRLHHRSRP